MAKKDLKDDEILRFLRFKITESAAATFTQVGYDTQLSIDRGFIWLIHSLEVEGCDMANVEDVAAGGTETIHFQITRESKTANLGIDDADVVQSMNVIATRYATIGTDAGPWCNIEYNPRRFLFPVPLIFGAQNIYFGVTGSGAAAKTVTGRLGYTIQKVSDKFFFRVAQAMIT